MDNEEKSIIKELVEIQKKLPNIVLPTMGMLEDNLKIKNRADIPARQK